MVMVIVCVISFIITWRPADNIGGGLGAADEAVPPVSTDLLSDLADDLPLSLDVFCLLGKAQLGNDWGARLDGDTLTVDRTGGD